MKIFFSDRSKAVLLLWFLFVIYVSCLSCCLICSLQPCGHLLGKGCVWCFLLVLSHSKVVFWVRCGTWSYRLLIFAFFLTLVAPKVYEKFNFMLEKIFHPHCLFITPSFQVDTTKRLSKWGSAWDFQQCGILTCVNSDEPVQSPVKLRNSKQCSVSSSTVIEYSSDKQRLWSVCAYAQADLSLCWSHIPNCWKSHALAQMVLNWSPNETPLSLGSHLGLHCKLMRRYLYSSLTLRSVLSK